MSNEFYVVIPARYASSRFPGKPLVDLAGKTMIQRVYEQALKSEAKTVVIALDDERIIEEVERFGGAYCLTRVEHQSGTDRLQEVCEKMAWHKDAIVVNVQGDEPLIPPENINQVAINLAENTDCQMASLVERIMDVEQVFNPNCVKAVMDSKGKALYFSRAPVPWNRKVFGTAADKAFEIPSVMPSGVNYYRHIGIYAYRVDLLNRFVHWEESLLEKAEALEQLRVLANGGAIHLAEAHTQTPPGIDTPEDVAAVLAALSTH